MPQCVPLPLPMHCCKTYSLDYCAAAAAAALCRLPLDSMIERLTASIGSQLSQQHFAVVDGLLGTTAATAMRQEILALHQVRYSAAPSLNFCSRPSQNPPIADPNCSPCACVPLIASLTPRSVHRIRTEARVTSIPEPLNPQSPEITSHRLCAAPTRDGC